jgi:hypothetical protein
VNRTKSLDSYYYSTVHFYRRDTGIFDETRFCHCTRLGHGGCVLMMAEATKIPWENINDALPAFSSHYSQPLTYSVTNGMIFGLATSAGLFSFWQTLKFFNKRQAMLETVRKPARVSEREEKKDNAGDGGYGSL